jgi:hypothetical protein
MEQRPTADGPECSYNSRPREASYFFGVTLEAIGCQVSRIAAPHPGHVFVLICALQRAVTCGVAVHATWMRQHLSNFAEDCLGTFG